jgi:hypothetical protein
MHLKNSAMVAAAVLMLASGALWAQSSTDPDAPFVWTTDPLNGSILVIEGGQASVLYSDPETSFSDLVYGPDELLYACSNEAGLIIRFDPTQAEPEIEVVHDAAVDGAPLAPECGWFTHKGALVVSDSYVPVEGDPANGVWIFPLNSDDYPECGETSPCQLVTPAELPAGFVGGGLTQAADGDLLVVDQGNGSVLGVPYDPLTGFETDDVEVLFDSLVAPIGIARLSTGEVFVTSGTEIQGWRLELPGGEGPGDKVWTNYCTESFDGWPDEGCSGYPQFLEATANDWLYLATVDACGDDLPEACEYELVVSGSLWTVDSNCQVPEVEEEIAPLFTYYGPAPEITGTLSGVALPPTSRTIELSYDPMGSGDLVFDFADHIYEVTAAGSCDATNTAFQTPPRCVDGLIPYDPDFEAGPVIYLGEGGFADVYNLSTPEDGGELVGCMPPGDVFLHAISAYTDLLDNPTIVRCEGQAGDLADICDGDVGSEDCDFLDLASFFPFDGALPDDGRIGSSGAASFSLYFLVDYGLTGGGAGTGSWCGFRPPVNNVLTPDDPGMSVFQPCQTIPFKFKVAAGVNGNCGKGPFIAPDGILLSIARVAPDFEAQEIVCVGGGCGAAPYFDPPHNPKSGFHMNVRTVGFEPGIYQAVLIATGGEFPVAWTYFEIVD